MALMLSKANRKPLANHSLIQFLSPLLPSSSFSAAADPPEQNPLASCLSDVKASLKQREEQQQKQQGSWNQPPRKPPSPAPSMTNRVGKAASNEEIRKILSGYRPQSPATGTGSNSTEQVKPRQQINIQDLFQRNAVAGGDSTESICIANNQPFSRRDGFQKITESLRGMVRDSNGFNARVVNDTSSRAWGRSSSAPLFGNIHGVGGAGEIGRMGGDFEKLYSYTELGNLLKKLRTGSQKQGQKGGFSLQELNERLSKVREQEKAEYNSKPEYKNLRNTLQTLQSVEQQTKQTKMGPVYNPNILSQLGATPDYMLHPPKEELVDKYFHPDNMSSQEKMKLELAKVREEFKMSESDCGSARVQVAQLTTKIKHLSSVLHKKDKHSRKGLQEMVQKRKKLLRYLRRTDWDSFTFVLSKLGLRDNPDYKNL